MSTNDDTGTHQASTETGTQPGGHQEHAPPSQTQDETAELQQQNAQILQLLTRRTQQRNHWKASYQALATKLDKLSSSQDRGFPQLDDSFMAGLVESLRTQIWKFATLYFGDLGHRLSSSSIVLSGLLAQYMDPAVRRGLQPETYLACPDYRAVLVEAFLWSFLVARVLGRFWWAGDVRGAVWNLHAAVKEHHTSTPSDTKTFQRWAATTTALLQESQKRASAAWKTSGTSHAKNKLVHEIKTALLPYRTTRRGGLAAALAEILDQAIDLDERISEQLAHFEWVFPRPGTAAFESGSAMMQVGDSDEVPAAETATVIVCPGIIKRGQLTGAENDAELRETVLLRGKVLCAVVADERFGWQGVVSAAQRAFNPFRAG